MSKKAAFAIMFRESKKKEGSKGRERLFMLSLNFFGSGVRR